jgi:hypothetical protein
MKAAIKAGDSDDRIRNRQRSKELKELSDKMRERLESIRKDLANDLYTRHVDTAEWQQRARKIPVVAADPVETLTVLLKEIEREAGRWSAGTQSSTVTNALPFPGPEGIEWRPRRATAIARILSNMKQEQEEGKDRELTRSLVESWLKGLVAKIGVLISYRKRYEQLLGS